MHLREPNISLLKELKNLLLGRGSINIWPRWERSLERRKHAYLFRKNLDGLALRDCPLDHLLDLIQIERLGHISKCAQGLQVFGILFAAVA